VDDRVWRVTPEGRKQAFEGENTMPGKRRQFSAEFKAKVALEAIRGIGRSMRLRLSTGFIRTWFRSGSRNSWRTSRCLFRERDQARQEASVQKERDELYRQIGQLKVEIDWLKKKTDPFWRG